MRNTVRLCKKYGVKAGTHVAFPDLVGFGRRLMVLTPEEYLYDSLYQGGALQAIARSEGEELQHFTWHGSAGTTFYGDNEGIARAAVRAVAMLDKTLVVPVIYGPKGDLLAREAEKLGLKVARKFFSDRALDANGMLVSRKKPSSMIKDPEECAERVLQMIHEGKVKSYEGQEIAVSGHKIMVHGNTHAAVNVAKTIRKKLDVAGIQVASIKEFV
jgi:UPF0271 protein